MCKFVVRLTPAKSLDDGPVSNATKCKHQRRRRQSGKLISQVDMTVYFGLCGYQRTPSYDAGFVRTVNFEGQNYLLDQHGNPIEDALGNPVVDFDIREFSVDARIAP